MEIKNQNNLDNANLNGDGATAAGQDAALTAGNDAVNSADAAAQTGDKPALFDINSLDREQLQYYIAHGKLPEGVELPAEKGAATADGDGKPDDDTTAGDPADDDAASGEGDDNADAVDFDFTFTENADEATRIAESIEVIGKFELPPVLQTAVQNLQSAVAERDNRLSEFVSLGNIETVRKTMTAVDTLVTFRKDEDTGDFVPDTSAFINLLKTDFGQEYRQVAHDIMRQPSEKYAGFTVFQEVLRDIGGLDARGMETLDYFLSNNGQMPIPSFTPEGLDRANLEAFWNAPDREEIQQQLSELQERINDPENTPDDRRVAQFELAQLNKKLSTIQAGLNAERNVREAAVKQIERQREEIQTAGAADYVETVVSLSREFTGKVAKSFQMFGDADGLAAMGVCELVKTALSDDEMSKHAQEDLAKQGINFDWKKGRAALDKLWNIGQKIAALNATKANPRAIDNARREKDDALKELRALETEVLGRITQKVVSGSNKALETKVKNAPKIKLTRPKVGGDGIKTAPKPNLEDLPLEELRKIAAQQNPFARAARGDLSGFSD